MNDIKSRARVGLFARWVVFSGLGLVAGIALALSVADPIEKLVGMMLVTPVVLVAAGSVLGGSQWLSFWRRRRIGWVWVGATGFGFGICMTLGIVIVEIAGRALTGGQMRLFDATGLERTISLFAIGVITGFGVGLSQWLVMRRQLQGFRWIYLTTLAFAIGFPSGAFIADLLPGGLSSILGFATFVCITGLIVGGVTAQSAQRMAICMADAETG